MKNLIFIWVCLCAVTAWCEEAPADALTPVLRMYDVSDLINPPRDFPSNQPGTFSSGQKFDANGVATTEVKPTPDAPAEVPSAPLKVSSLLHRWFAPGIADELEPMTTLRGTQLFINAPKAFHDHVTVVLTQQRRQLSLQIRIKVTDFDLSDDVFYQIRMAPNLNWFLDLGTTRSVSARAPLDVLKKLKDIAEHLTDTCIVQTPELTIFNNQKANVSFIDQYSFIDAPIAGRPYPNVQILNVGRVYDFRPTATADGNLIRLAFTVNQCDRLKPTVTSVPSPQDAKISLQVEEPVIVQQNLKVDRTIISGQCLLVAPNRTYGLEQIGRHHILVVEARLLDDDEKPKPTPAF